MNTSEISRENILYIKEESRWESLILKIGKQNCSNYMYMYSKIVKDEIIHCYKHINTREYLKLAVLKSEENSYAKEHH